jgi:hypothetical protein
MSVLNRSRAQRLPSSGISAIMAAGVALLAMFTFLLIANPPLANAAETHYCWGATVTASEPCAPPYSYDAAYATGVQHSICLQPWFHHEKTKCTSGPGDSVYLESTYSEGEPFAIIDNAPGKTTVYAVGYYYPSRHEGGGGGGGGESPPPPLPEWHTENLGGSITEAPDIASWGSGRLDVFGRKSDGSLTHNWWNGSSWNSTWETIGAPGTFASGIGAAGSSGHEINVVGWSSSNAALDEWWSGSTWQLVNFGGSVLGSPDFDSPIDGSRADVWVRGAKNTLEHRWWTGSEWSAWANTGVAISSSPGAVSWGAGRTDVVTRAPNGSVQDTWWNGTETQTTNLGGTIEGAPTIASWAPGRLDVFVKGTDNALWTNWFEGGEWHTWHSLGGNLASDPGAVSWGPGRIDVVARLTNGTVQHWWWQQ